jgi:hypothetical protein
LPGLEGGQTDNRGRQGMFLGHDTGAFYLLEKEGKWTKQVNRRAVIKDIS